MTGLLPTKRLHLVLPTPLASVLVPIGAAIPTIAEVTTGAASACVVTLLSKRTGSSGECNSVWR
jgi:hypothetical protein